MPGSTPSRTVQFWDRWERHISVGTMVLGFSFDLIIAKRPDSLYDNALLLTYFVASAVAIVLLNIRARHSADAPAERPLALLLMLQFCFGGLSGNLLILYGKSGTPTVSLLFLLLLFGMLIGNELLRDRYSQARFNIGIYYLLLLTYCIIAVPTFILHSIGPKVFLISGSISLAVIALLFLIFRTASLFRGDAGKRLRRELGVIVIGIFIAFNGLYFLNIIPPVPLALKDIGIYHYVGRDATGGFFGQYEAAPWWEFWRATSSTYSVTTLTGSTAFCFSSVFAPTGLTTPIHHRWEYYNPKTKKWETTATVSFPITGGLATGYRGFSQKALPAAGKWRCEVETAQNQLIGRASFTAVGDSKRPIILSREL